MKKTKLKPCPHCGTSGKKSSLTEFGLAEAFLTNTYSSSNVRLAIGVEKPSCFCGELKELGIKKWLI